MDTFGDNFDQPEADPVAEFLVREQNALAGLEDEVQPVANSINPPVQQQLPKAENAAPEYCGSFEMIDNLADQVNSDNNEPFAPTQPTPPPIAREEPERIRKWREEQKTRLEQKDVEEEKKKEELRIQAKQELEDWYKHNEEAIKKTKMSNRTAEKQFSVESDGMEPGTEWERIAKLCDFNPKGSKSSKDVSRMRSIILQLKQNPLNTTKKL